MTTPLEMIGRIADVDFRIAIHETEAQVTLFVGPDKLPLPIAIKGPAFDDARFTVVAFAMMIAAVGEHAMAALGVKHANPASECQGCPAADICPDADPAAKPRPPYVRGVS